MDPLLREEAGRAQDIADILSTIRNYDQDHVQEITLAITGLNNLSWALRELNDQIDAIRGILTKGFADDLTLLQNSVAFTLQDVWTILGKIPRDPVGADYRNAWKEISRYCLDMGKQTLHMRLETYQLFLYGLCKKLKRQSYSRRQIDDLRHEIFDLQSLQRDNRKLISATETFANLSLVPVQPGTYQPQTQRPMSPTTSHDSYDTLQHQAAPSPPALSPTTTFSTISHTSSVDPETSHWATNIFNNLPTTSLEDDPMLSTCFGDSSGRGRSFPDSEFERILQLKFPGGLRTKFYWRPRDYRCKLVCEWPDPRRGTRMSCFPLTDLHIRRSGPFLYLCRPTVTAPSTCWTSLKFTSYEWLVIFHCTFLSLRSHDSARHVSNHLDHRLKEETSNFAGAIRDSGFKHALRLYRDRGTDAVRLEASVLDGEMQHTPIWTAFITHCITSPTWYRWPKNSSTVYLAELQRHVFSSQYSAHIAANGEHFLDFELIQDAEDFVKTLQDFGDEYRRTKTVL
ncbi:uncharacterized protein Z518_06903 [Rhinocladiella mackenziei CBS 650.93]|uniref:Uncharacterized protein n=1 Tax=Rhinocladiella mackenziei CBS 650.93 TaxID=1442369 RepID=A0A0D2IJB6_9EURO|nr:uncharacterized protein Z518_06903 [Rhinocladiella mackenziei CBS 650.93]KIX03351.1 hypothetical protein Z518_06903 [Rhinocladiella mackenziei CBS 650.93]